MNKAKLRYEMEIKGVKAEEMCRVVGISKSAFYRKMNGVSEFTQSEIQKIVDYLGLESPVGILFDEKVSQKTQLQAVRWREMETYGTLEPERCLSILQGLLNYHERVLLGDIYCINGDKRQKCLVSKLYDPYKEAIQEAVRCVKIVHQLEDDC